MYKILRNRKILLCGILPDLQTDEISFEKYKEARGLFIQNPWERVRSIFSKDDYGNWHPELISAIQMAQFGALGGLFYGGLKETIKSSENFFRTNDANIYLNKREAYKVFNNHTLLASVKGFLKWGPTFALFFGTFSLISSCCELYRNKVGLLENIVAGVSVGALNRFMFGIKGMISGGIFGGLLGTVYGTTLWGLSKLSKTDRLEIKYSQFAFSKYRKEKRNQASENEKDKEFLNTGLHARHVINPLDEFENEEKEKEKNLSEKQNK